MPQCHSCGLVYAKLADPLCHECVNHWSKFHFISYYMLNFEGTQPALPTLLARNPTIKAQVDNLQSEMNSSAVVADILQAAEGFRMNATQVRMPGAGVQRAQNSKLIKAAEAAASARKLPTFTRAKAVIARATATRQGMIQIEATLWVYHTSKKGRTEMTAVCCYSVKYHDFADFGFYQGSSRNLC